MTTERRENFLAGLLDDLAYGVRLARRTPVTALTIILIVALGIGGSTAVFSVVNNTLLRPMMLPDVDRIVRIDDVSVGAGGMGTETNISPRNYTALSEAQRSFDAVTVQDARWFVASGGGDPERLRGAGVSRGWIETLGVRPLVGRTFTTEELDAAAGSDAVIIGHGFWQRRFAGSADAIGSTITLNDRPRVVVGVMPPGFRFPYEAEVWVPIAYDAQEGGAHYMLAFGRLREDVSLDRAQQELAALSLQLAEQYPETNRDWQMRAQPLRDNLVRGYDRTALALLATVGFLLVIGCVNVAALVLARATQRSQELVVRAALGANRARQARQLSAELFVLAAAGGVIGLFVAMLLRPMLGTLVPPTMSVELAQNEIALDLRVFGFALALVLVTVVFAGLLPSLRALPRDLGSVLRQSRSSSARVSRRTVRGLVIGEVALAMVLLVGAGGVVLGFTRAFGGPAGYNADGVLALRIALPDSRYAEPGAHARAATALLEQINAAPGVTSAALSTTNPRLQSWTAGVLSGDAQQGDQAQPVQLVLADGPLQRTLGTRVIAGREIEERDRADAPPVVVVSANLAERLWPGENALGRTLMLEGAPPQLPKPTVIGVVDDVRWADETDAAIYLPYQQAQIPMLMREFHLFVRTPGDEAAVVGAVRAAVARVDAGLPLFGVAPLEDVRGPEYELARSGAGIGAGFAVLGTILAALGIFGTLSYSVAQSRHEWAVRKAVGAAPMRIFSSLIGEGIVLLAIGGVIGVAGGIALSTTLSSVLTDMAPLGRGVYAALFGVLIAVGLIACAAPARRAARVEPMIALRDS